MAPPPPRPILERPPFSMPPFRLAVRVAASGREAREVGNILHRTRVGTRGSLYDTIRPASERAAAVYNMGATETPPRSGAVHYDIFYSPRPDAPEPATTPPSVLVPRLQRATVRIAKGKQPVRRQHRQQDGHRLLEADGPGERRPAQDERREETQLDTVRLVVGDAVAAEGVCWRGGQRALDRDKKPARKTTYRADRPLSRRSHSACSWSARIRWFRRRP